MFPIPRIKVGISFCHTLLVTFVVTLTYPSDYTVKVSGNTNDWLLNSEWIGNFCIDKEIN